MNIKLKKQPKKYLSKVDNRTHLKLTQALEKLGSLEGDIKRLTGGKYGGYYRYKIEHYRMIFALDKNNELIIVEIINTRTNIKY